MIKKISLFLVLVFCVNFQNQIYGKILYESIQGYTKFAIGINRTHIKVTRYLLPMVLPT